MSLLAAELLKMYRRPITYVLLFLLIGVMFLVLALAGVVALGHLDSLGGAGDIEVFPLAYAFVGDFVFGLGSLFAIVYAAAIVGAEYSWGVLRNPFSRGESRTRYALAKAAGLALMLAAGSFIAFLAGILLILLGALLTGLPVGSPLAPEALGDLGRSLGLGLVVLLERAAIGFAVAVLLRSQLAGIVVGIVLSVGEPILGTMLGAITFFSRAGAASAEAAWNQFLPFSIGNSVLADAQASLLTRGTESLVGPPPVALGLALPAVLLYLVAAVALAVLVMRRQEIVN